VDKLRPLWIFLVDLRWALVVAGLGCSSADKLAQQPDSEPAFDSGLPSKRSGTADAGSVQHTPVRSAPAGDAAAPAMPSTQGDCAMPSYTPLFGDAPVQTPIIERRDDGVIVTRGAGRVRGRHELEETYSPFLSDYFENRSYGFVIEDTVAAGGTSVKFTYLPEAPVSAHGATTNFRHWKIYGNGNVFHSNVSMQQVTPQELEYTVDRNARENRPMQVGDLLEFEFGIFITGNNAADPEPIEGRTSYYTDTFRYRVGVGGLTPDNADTSEPLGPHEKAWLAGTTTIPWIVAEPELSFSQMALDMQPEHVQAFLHGRRLFHTDFATGEHSDEGNPVFKEQIGKLGPLSNATRCVSCHVGEGRGALPAVGAPLQSMAVKLYAPHELGNQLQSQEGQASLERYEPHAVTFDDGSSIMLQRPVFAFHDLSAGVDASALKPSIRVARQNPGMGLLEAIPESQILARAVAADCDSGGVSGRAQWIEDPAQAGVMRLGRFGWKAEKVSVAHQVADALSADLGVSNPIFPEADGSAELNQSDFDELVTYTRLLALPARRDIDDPKVQSGEALFMQIGCDNCHVPDASTGDAHPFVELRAQQIHPYTDLLLHEMGEDLADGSGAPQASEWRTPPLWGIGMLKQVSAASGFLHDGRARDPIEAVLWHGGEAAFARAALIGLSAAEREALAAFLGSL
jgi:CxxC motif-containing protein (DUF1111 family)